MITICLFVSPSFALLSSSFSSSNDATSKLSYQVFESLKNKNFTDINVYKEDLIYNSIGWIEKFNNINSTGLSLRNIAESYGGYVYLDWPEYARSGILIPNENYSEFVNKFISLGFRVIETPYLRIALDESKNIIGLPYTYGTPSTELTGNGISIAIVDTGINCTHPDINDCLVDGQGKLLSWFDQINSRNLNPFDDNGHGTHVASTAAGTGVASNGRYKGIAPSAGLIIEKACNSLGSCDPNFVGQAIQDSLNFQPDILSLSLGYPNKPGWCDCTDAFVRPICDGIHQALNNNVMVFAAAGNSVNKPGSINFPGCMNGVIAIGATHKSGYTNDYFPTNMDLPNSDTFLTTIHSIITVTSDNPPQVFESEWTGIKNVIDKGFEQPEFQRLITPNRWPATIKVQVEAQHKQRDCGSIINPVPERGWWDPGYTDKSDEYWTWERTFNYDSTKPYVLVELGEISEYRPSEESGVCPGDLTGWWKAWYNNYSSCTGTASSCDSYDTSKNKCNNQPGCGWCGCRMGTIIYNWCEDIPQFLCESPPPGVLGGTWTACEGTARACSDRKQEDGQICGTPSTTGCTATWNKDNNIFVKFSPVTGWEGIPRTSSGRGPSPLTPPILKPEITAPGQHICAARGFEGQTTGTQDCAYTDYVSDSGTSMATPIVSGTAALLMEYYLHHNPTVNVNTILDALTLTADQKIFPDHPNMEEGYGRLNAQKAINRISNCELKYPDPGYKDTDLPKCSSYNYNSFSSANQMREYSWSDSIVNCDCNAIFDSYLNSVSVNGLKYEDTAVDRNQNIIVDVDVKNTGLNQQGWWYLGVEFWNVSDYSNPWNSRDTKGRINAFYNGRTGVGGCDTNPDPINAPEGGQCPSGVTCSIVSESVTANGKLDPGETIRVRCQAPASFYPLSSCSQKQRVMLWVHERDLGQDAGNNGNAGNDWWNDALAIADPSSIRVVVTNLPSCQGDINGDGKRDIYDAILLANNFGKTTSTGDLNGDCKVDIYDAILMANKFNKVC